MLIGALGGLISELVRVAPSMLKNNKFPGPVELVVSIIYVALGAGVALFGWNDPKAVLAVAIQGAAFPAVFANLVKGATTASDSGGGPQPPQPTRSGPVRTKSRTRVAQSAVDYMAGRF